MIAGMEEFELTEAWFPPKMYGSLIIATSGDGLLDLFPDGMSIAWVEEPRVFLDLRNETQTKWRERLNHRHASE